jgi:hypothetical protein
MTVVHDGTYRLKRGQFPAFWVVKNYSGAQSSFGRTVPFLVAAVKRPNGARIGDLGVVANLSKEVLIERGKLRTRRSAQRACESLRPDALVIGHVTDVFAHRPCNARHAPRELLGSCHRNEAIVCVHVASGDLSRRLCPAVTTLATWITKLVEPR